MVAAQAACVPGANRREVAGAFLRRYHELGGHHVEIDPIFEAMPRRRDDGFRTSTGDVAFPTGLDGTRFEEGDLVWVDCGIGYEGYASDFGRTWIVGRDPNAAEQSLFDRFMTVLDAAYGEVRAGATLGDVGRAAIAANGGVVPWLPHFYLAHGVGLESAEMPMIGTDLGQAFDDGYVLEPGMVLVFEPVIWEDGVGSYRAEEICAVTETGWRHLGGGHGYPPYRS
jgi:Xaa-Pro aminopeptidase